MNRLSKRLAILSATIASTLLFSGLAEAGSGCRWFSRRPVVTAPQRTTSYARGPVAPTSDASPRLQIPRACVGRTPRTSVRKRQGGVPPVVQPGTNPWRFQEGTLAVSEDRSAAVSTIGFCG